MIENKYETIPERMSFNLDYSIKQVDIEMKSFSKAYNVSYISPYDVFCNADGCLTVVGSNPEKLTAFDTVHLTRDGASFFINNVADKMFLRSSISKRLSNSERQL
jgi:hypothetical protein